MFHRNPRLASSPATLPTPDELGQLLPAAMVAFAVRCAWRIQPLVGPQSFGTDNSPQDIAGALCDIDMALLVAARSCLKRESEVPVRQLIDAEHAAAASSSRPLKTQDAIGAMKDAVEVAMFRLPVSYGASAHSPSQLAGRCHNQAQRAARAVHSRFMGLGDEPDPGATPRQGEEAVAFLHRAAREDVEWLREHSSKLNAMPEAMTRFFELPLWGGDAPVGWLDLMKRWSERLRKLDRDARTSETGHGLTNVYARAQRLFNGEGVDWKDAEGRIEARLVEWQRRFGTQPTAPSANSGRPKGVARRASAKSEKLGPLERVLPRQDELRHLPPRAIAVYAARCAQRVQPLVRPASFQGQSKGDIARQLWTLDASIAVALIAAPRSAAQTYALGDSVRAGADKIEPRDHEVALAMRAAADAVYTLARIEANADAADSAARAASNALRAIAVFSQDTAAVLAKSARDDFEFAKGIGPTVVLDELRARRLWTQQPPGAWQRLVDSWKRHLKRLAKDTQDESLASISERYQWMALGERIDPQDVIGRIDDRIIQLVVMTAPALPDESIEASTASSSLPQQVAQPSDPTSSTKEVPQHDRLIPLRSVTDEPTSRDLLGRGELVCALASMFADPEQATPFTMALLGDWGAGKSSIKEQLQARLSSLPSDSATEFLFADFDAWQYEHTADIRAGLAQEVIKGLTEDLSWLARQRLKLAFGWRQHRGQLVWAMVKLGSVFLAGGGIWLWTMFLEHPGVEAGLIQTGILAGVTVFTGFIGAQVKRLLDHPVAVELATYLRLPDYGQHLGVVRVMHTHLCALCDLREVSTTRTTWRDRLTWLPALMRTARRSRLRRLIVWVDNLDRCGPKCITEVLDAVRLVMDIRNVVVVLMMDHRIAFNAVARHYRLVADDRRDETTIARDYLGKIIQLSVLLPKPGSMRGFVSERLFPNVAVRQSSNSRVAFDASATGVSSPETATVATTDGANPLLALDEEHVERDHRSINLTEARAVGEVTPEAPPIEFRESDRDRFERWSAAYDFTNPRQLIRLRNTYCLILHLDAIRRGSEVREDAGRSEQAVAMLFWLEFMWMQKREDHQRWEEALVGVGITPPEPVAGRVDWEQLRRELHAVFDTERNNDAYFRLKEEIGLFVLPFGEVRRAPTTPKA